MDKGTSEMKNRVEEVEKQITVNRNILHDLIEEDGELNQSEIVKASQKLDEVLNKYNQLIKDIEGE